MNAPADARDAEEGWCEECSDWLSWDDLEACIDCGTVVCTEHSLPEDHECEEVGP